MKKNFRIIIIPIIVSILWAGGVTGLFGQPKSKHPETPLPQALLNILANEISGQMIFDNEVILAGAPWVRDAGEFSEKGRLFEAAKIVELAKKYGIKTIKLERSKRDRKGQYPMEGEFWLTKPEHRLIARLDGDAALVCNGSQTVDIKAPLVYIPPFSKKILAKGFTKKEKKVLKGKIALMWSHPRKKTAKWLDEAGIQGVIAFNARDRYLDPNQVVYGRTNTKGMKNLKFGFMISWRQWSELLEDLENRKPFEAHCKIRMISYQDKYETVLAWIPGTEPQEKGVMFTAHLFEGYVKRGANDNMSGCVVQLEILRALTKLIKNKTIPQPKRNIYFLWPNEISGTFEFIKNNPDLMSRIDVNINMDMVGEGLRKNNAVFTFSESSNNLPSYLDGLGNSIMNYIWRTNDIVYLPDSPRGRRGQHFPKPMWEKNGSTDAFRYDIHLATGGSDHICFRSPTVAIPGVELNVWPDQWYHADTDTPDKSDPTQMRRVAFLGAAMALVIADCSDKVLPQFLRDISSFGYLRIGERELPRLMNQIQKAGKKDFSGVLKRSLDLLEIAVNRELGALNSVQDVYSKSEPAKKTLNEIILQWQLYRKGLENLVNQYAEHAGQRLALTNFLPEKTPEELKYEGIVPEFTDAVKYKEFRVERSKLYQDYMKKLKELAKGKKKKQAKKKEKGDTPLTSRAKRNLVNWINGKISITKIRDYVAAETGKDINLNKVIEYFELLEKIGWVQLKK